MYDTTLEPETTHQKHPREPGISHDYPVARPASTTADLAIRSGAPSCHVTPVIGYRTRLALERDILARLILEFRSEREELRDEVDHLEGVVEQQERKRQQLIERYERIIEAHRREYRDLRETTQESRSCSEHLRAALNTLFED